MTSGADRPNRAPPAFATALEDTPLFVVGLDERGVVTYANAAFGGANGAVGRDFADRFLRGDDAPRFREWFLRAPDERRKVRFEGECALVDGQRRFVRWAAALGDPQGPQASVLLIGDDVTDQRNSERALAETERTDRIARVEMLDAASQALAQVSLDYRGAIDTVVRRAAELVGETCAIGLVPEAGGALSVLAVYNVDPVLRAAITGILSLAPHAIRGSAVEQVLGAGVPVLLSTPQRTELSIDLVEEFQMELRQIPVRAILLVPMRLHGRVIGALGLCRHAAERPYSIEDQVFVQSLADRAALTIHNAHLYAENQKQAEELRQANIWLEKRIEERTAELERVNEQLLQQAIEDGLTGLANRRHFNSVLSMELRRARRDGSFLSLLLADVDHFKRYNDTQGHLAGDQCLRNVADVLRRSFRRATDLTARFGGEEFAIVLSGCDPENARRLAERCRLEISKRPLSGGASPVTVSIGVVSSRASSDTTADWYVRIADLALYASKNAGRNRVTLCGEVLECDGVLESWFEPPAASAALLERKIVAYEDPPVEVVRMIESRFREHVERARAGELDGYSRSAKGRIALVLLLDLFARALYAGKAAAFDGGEAARRHALEVLEVEPEGSSSLEERLCMILCLAGAEDLGVLGRALAHVKRLCDGAPPRLLPACERAAERIREQHDVIARFGRFPNRNETLRRASTEEELAFLRLTERAHARPFARADGKME